MDQQVRTTNSKRESFVVQLTTGNIHPAAMMRIKSQEKATILAFDVMLRMSLPTVLVRLIPLKCEPEECCGVIALGTTNRTA